MPYISFPTNHGVARAEFERCPLLGEVYLHGETSYTIIDRDGDEYFAVLSSSPQAQDYMPHVRNRRWQQHVSQQQEQQRTEAARARTQAAADRGVTRAQEQLELQAQRIDQVVNQAASLENTSPWYRDFIMGVDPITSDARPTRMFIPSWELPTTNEGHPYRWELDGTHPDPAAQQEERQRRRNAAAQDRLETMLREMPSTHVYGNAAIDGEEVHYISHNPVELTEQGRRAFSQQDIDFHMQQLEFARTRQFYDTWYKVTKGKFDKKEEPAEPQWEPEPDVPLWDLW